MESLQRKVLVVVLAQSQHFCLSEAARSSRGQGAVPLLLWPLYLEKPSFLGKHSVHPPPPSPSCSATPGTWYLAPGAQAYPSWLWPFPSGK